MTTDYGEPWDMYRTLTGYVLRNNGGDVVVSESSRHMHHIKRCVNACAGLNAEALPELLAVVHRIAAWDRESIGQLDHLITELVAAYRNVKP